MTPKEFKHIYDSNMDAYTKACEAAPWEDKKWYSNWAAQTFFYVSFSSRVISLASAYVPLKHNDLHSRLVKHAGEEEKHELLALRDLKALNQTIDAFHEFPSTSALYQSQYFYATHGQAYSLMGYFLSLEGLAINVAARAHERAEKAHGARASNFLKVHAAEDIEHVEQAFHILKSFSPEELKLVAKNLEQTRFYYTQMIKDCGAELQVFTSHKKAA